LSSFGAGFFAGLASSFAPGLLGFITTVCDNLSLSLIFSFDFALGVPGFLSFSFLLFLFEDDNS
jgi:hypothetical protein